MMVAECASLGVDCSLTDAGSELKALERRWYASLDSGEPDWSVYDEDVYMAELWDCWTTYSRPYLRAIRGDRSMEAGGSITEDLGRVRSVVDLGCGFGLTTAALAQLFPDAEVFGTNIEDVKQRRIADSLGERYGFKVVEASKIRAPVDLVFASEFFEHLPVPVGHLRRVLARMKPRALLIANTFTSPAIGHFPEYEVGDEVLPGRSVSRRFNAVLRTAGYAQQKTRMWNQRPAYWKRP